jgi:hypothetical protein
MTPKQAAKTLISGLAFILGSTSGALAWGVHREIVVSVPASSAGIFFAITLVAFAIIPAVCFAFKEAK